MKQNNVGDSIYETSPSAKKQKMSSTSAIPFSSFLGSPILASPASVSSAILETEGTEILDAIDIQKRNMWASDKYDKYLSGEKRRKYLN